MSDHPDKNINLPCATVGMPHQSFKWSLNHMASTRLAVSPQTYASDDVFVHQLAVLSTRRTVGLPSDALSRSRPCHSLVVDIPSNNCKVTKNGDFPTEDFHRGGLPLISLCPCWAYQKSFTGCYSPVSSMFFLSNFKRFPFPCFQCVPWLKNFSPLPLFSKVPFKPSPKSN